MAVIELAENTLCRRCINSSNRNSDSLMQESANKSNVFSANYRTARYAKDSAVKCLDLFKLSDKVDGRYRHTGCTAKIINNEIRSL